MPFHPRLVSRAQPKGMAPNGMIRMPGRRPLPCVVQELSQGGAVLHCEVPRSLPYQFQLVIEATKTLFACEARHCDATTIGVRFVKTR